MIKRSVYWENTIIIKSYAPTMGEPKYIKQILTDLKWKNRQLYNNSKGLWIAYFHQ